MRTQYLLGSQWQTTPTGEAIPADATIYNATRPLAGAYWWEGEWIRGRWFAVVLADAVRDHKMNADLDATRLQWIDSDAMRQELATYYAEKYPNLDIDLSDSDDNELLQTYQTIKAN